MIRNFLSGVVALLSFSSLHAADLIERAEASELRLSSGKAIARVERDDEGHVTRLRLNDFKLSPADITEISAEKHLSSLVLFRTNVSDEDVAKLTQCVKLQHLNLTSTDVTDNAIASILKMKKLKSLCIGNVGITPDGIEKLKANNRS